MCMALFSGRTADVEKCEMKQNGTGLDGEFTKNEGGFGSVDGAYLTWEELTVTVSGGKKGPISILQDVTGYARPGEVLAIMGPSGCGKSTLLDALAGRLASNTRQTGDVLINGRKQQLTYGTSAYLTQEDVLICTLTVREAVYYSAMLQLPNSMSKADKVDRAERTIREMGLQDAMNRRIGGYGNKSLSGGQKKRVSICIELLTRPKLLYLDEPTSGLDSAASFYVMSQIVKLARQYEMTVLVCIHQPSSEVFALFHNLCLLSLGRVIYFGPSNLSNQFFAANGFPTPALQNPADHYLRTINNDFDQDIEQGLSGKLTTEQVTNLLVRSYKASDTCKDIQRTIAEIMSQERGVIEMKGSQASFFRQCIVLTQRSFVNMYRDKGYYWLRLFIYIGLAIGIGTLFFDIGSGYGSIHARGSMLMYVASFLTMMAIGGFPSFVEEMKVFARERLNGHYGAGSYVIANSLSSAPYLIIISLIPGGIIYYLVGLQRGNAQFLCFISILVTCMMLVEGLMMVVATMVPNYLMGLTTGAAIQGIMMLSGGFFQLPNDLPNIVWKYPLYYISFHKYAYQGLYKNEFEGLKFPSSHLEGAPLIDGPTILKSIWQVDMGYSKWIDVVVLLAMVITYRILFFFVIKIAERIKPVVRVFMSDYLHSVEETGKQ
ncbi:ABC transporter, G1, P-loop containing nucleoside triphosphate hydrolase [Heracleum sosnowskyi]|uniref:ABC transporter, G1, P-loop containing nucleoside triphosphate hydrolase n=1 Tax=Heracleum sosnowskyi TaxID=360622 RepID=A0AAD8GQ28_9APIA|nr:ABC transporter, G1, P-loop containing nucleoside triphosphate hydrolase [Heracleum sosnowskyi]